MASQSLIQIILEVLKDPRVIVTAIICFVAMDLSCYIVRYRKKPKIRKRKVIAASQAATTKADSQVGSSDSQAAGEESSSSSANSSADSKSAAAHASK